MIEQVWDNEDENIFGAVVMIAHFTGFSKQEILSWTLDEINKALEIIKNQERKQAHLLFAIADYERLINAEPTNSDGKINTTEKDKLINKAKNLRAVFTGEKVEKEDNNSKFFGMKNQRVAEEMTVEEFKKYKAENL